jgi:CTP synthase (UTP-ammonia lyase)
MVRIGVMGEYLAGYPPVATIEAALTHSAAVAACPLRVGWVPTSSLRSHAAALLGKFHGLLGAPGNLESVEGALEGIRFARESDIPYVGTCGGFQHAVLEYAGNVAGIKGVAHEAYEPSADALVLTALTCSIFGQKMTVAIQPNSRAHAAFGAGGTTEEYYCKYGINPDYEQTLIEHGLVISGRDQQGEPRILELPRKRFFMASLFVPQVRSSARTPHPLLTAFVKAASDVAGAQASQ